MVNGEPADRTVVLLDGRIGRRADAGGVDAGVVLYEVADGYDVQVDHVILRLLMEQTSCMAMNYYGPATLVAAGLAALVVADLRIEYGTFEMLNDNGSVTRERGRKEWFGSLQGDAGGSLWAVLDASPRVRLPDGREGTFITSTMSSDGHVEIQGTGPAPFWDEADEPTS